ncbi:MAG TPA: hypothetical protein VFN53_06545 [Acidobacteriaceae bacterium]|nr:hypothetical protein [Acidobacteriaceae bacterium]
MANNVQFDVGLHRGKILDHGLSKAKSGTDQVFIRFEVVAVKDGSDWHPVDHPKERTVYMAVTEKTIKFVADALDALGYTGGSFANLEAQSAPAYSLVGEQRDFWCKHEVYNGNTNEKWSVSIPRAQAEPMDKRDVRNLDSLFGSALKKKPVAAKAAKPATVASTEITDDDIPF